MVEHELDLIPSWSDPLNLLRGDVPDEGRRQLARMREIFARSAPSRVSEEASSRIPRVIHRIWMGTKAPAWVEQYAATWRLHHPDWEFVLWDDERIRAERFSTQDLVDQASCYGQKADLLRMEILARHGGLYVDCDFECFRSLEPFARRYDFFSSAMVTLQSHLGWPTLWPSPLIVNTALIGARAGHPVLTGYLRDVRAGWRPAGAYRLDAAELPAVAIFAMGGRDRADHLKELALRTYLPYHDAVLKYAEGPRDVILPHYLLHPTLTGGHRALLAMPQFWAKVPRTWATLTRLRDYDRVWPESFANHVSKRSWLKRPRQAASAA